MLSFNNIKKVLFLIALAWSSFSSAELKPSCLQLLKSLASAPKESIGLFEGITELRPTQFDYGLPRVRYIQEKIKGMDFLDVQLYLDEHPIPVVLGPKSDRFMVDRHNTLRGLAESQEHLLEKFGDKAHDLKIRLVVIEDKSSLSEDEFFRQMFAESLLYPYRKDQLMNFSEIPKQVLDLKKDYFRGMAWLLKKAGIIGANTIPFSDFMWATKLREINRADDTIWSKSEVRSHLENFVENYDKFNNLPGYTGETPSVDEAMKVIDQYLI